MFQGRRANSVAFIVTLICLMSAPAIHAQTTDDVGGFNRQYWDKGDGGGSGAYVIVGSDNGGNPVTILPDSDIFTFSTAQKASIDLGFEYWGDVLGLGAADVMSPVVRVVGQDITTVNANSVTFTDGMGSNSVYSRIELGNDPARLDDIDSRLVIFNTPYFNTQSVTQLDGTRSLQSLVIHELGHSLGIAQVNAVVPANVNTSPAGAFNTPFTDDFNNLNPFAMHQGTNSTAVFGADVPLGYGNGHFVIPFSVMSRGYFVTANNEVKDYRNNIAFTPVELAVLADIGYNIDLTDHFAAAFYQDGNGMQQSVMGGTPSKDFGVGAFIQADNLNLLFDNELSANGTFGTGIRMNGGQEAIARLDTNIFQFQLIKTASTNGNLLTIDENTSVSANGTGGIGFLQSAGANSVIVHRGTLNATGVGGRGMVFDFGSNNAFDEANSDDYNMVMVNRLDISGTINSDGPAILIDDSAAFGTMNIMDGAEINGDIITNGRQMNTITNTAYARSMMTFGYEADMDGQVMTGTPDANFSFNHAGNIGGSNNFDATFAGGDTNFSGTTMFQDADILSGASLATSGTFGSTTLDVMSGATAETMGGTMNVTTFNLQNGGLLVNNGTIASNTFNTGSTSRIEGNGLISANNPITLNGTTAPGNSIGTMTFNSDVTFSPSSITEIEVQPSANPVPGTDNDLIQVNGSATFEGGSVDVIGLPNNGAYTAGATYTYVTATGGVAVNTAPVFTEDLVNFRTVPFFTFNSAGFMLANDAAYGPQGISYNQRNVGNYLDIVKQNAGNTLVQSLRDQLDLLPGPSAVRGALDNLSGEIYGSSAIYQIQSMSHLMDVLANQVHHNHSPAIPCMDELWYSGYATSGQADHDGNAHDTDLNSIGHLVGKSWCVGPETVMGVFYNYEDQRARAFGVGSTLDTDAHRLGYYLRDQRGVFHTVFTAFTGWMNAESERVVSVNALTERNRGDYNGWNAGFLLEQGATVGNTYVQTQPFVSIQYLHAQTENFTENGGAVTSLRVNDIDLNSFRTKVGNRLNLYTFRKLLSVDLEGAWIYEVGDSVANYDGGLTSAPGTQFAARGTDLGENWFNIGPSMNWMTGPFRTYLEYRAALGEQANLHSGQWGTELIW